jgi:hypothetical protein
MRRLLVVLLLLGRTAFAADDPVAEARKGFVEGTELVKRAQWSEALAAFERSARLHAHAVTTFNIAACERAMGRYTRARALFRRALDESTAGTGKLPESLAEQARAHRDEIDRLLARIEVTVDPPEAAVAVDGRPLELLDGNAKPPLAVAGVASAGPGAPPPARTFALLADPGPHVFLLARKGFTDVVLNKTFAPGAKTTLRLQLDLLPATLHIEASRPGAVVSVDGKDVGPAPAEVQRAPGTYKVAVEKPGFVTYRASVSVRAGEQADLRATLEEKKTPIYKRWWFWTTFGVVLAGVGVGTYFAAREPARLDGGGLGWTIQVR